MHLLLCSSQQPVCLRHFGHRPPPTPTHVGLQHAAWPHQLASLLPLGLLTVSLLAAQPCQASIPLRPPADPVEARARAAAQLGAQYLPPRALEREAAPAVPASQRIEQGLALLQRAREQMERGEYGEALASYNQLAQGGAFSEFGFTEYARMERALVLYQLGSVSDALLALQDEEVALRGNAGVHAALAAVLYAERPGQRLYAEEQWELACEFDQRYADADWVARTKHWPPRALAALQRFLQLK